MSRLVRILTVLAAIALIGALAWWLTHRGGGSDELTLYGNVDLRQVDLAFNASERIAAVLVEEGDHVQAGQVLARLDTNRLAPEAERAEAEAGAQRQVVERLHHGSRPEEIDQTRATLAAARADAANATAQFERVRSLAESSAGRAVSRQDVDAARAAADAASARLTVAQKGLALALAGPRHEDIAGGEAQLRASEASLALLRQELREAELRAPVAGIVRSRLLEPGDMASPQKAVFTVALTNPKWIRAYVDEADLGRIHEGMKGEASTDAAGARRFPGWVGFISPVAEFTPKSVETTELRSSLVYEVRFFVTDPGDELRLGMPATVHLPAAGRPGRAAAGT